MGVLPVATVSDLLWLFLQQAQAQTAAAVMAAPLMAGRHWHISVLEPCSTTCSRKQPGCACTCPRTLLVGQCTLLTPTNMSLVCCSSGVVADCHKLLHKVKLGLNPPCDDAHTDSLRHDTLQRWRQGWCPIGEALSPSQAASCVTALYSVSVTALSVLGLTAVEALS